MSAESRLADQPSAQEIVPCLIGGVLSTSREVKTVDVINPSNGQRCLSISAGCDEDADRAVASARESFEDGRWSELPPSTRKKTLLRLADLIAVQAAVLDRFDALEMGKPVSVTLANAAAGAGLMSFHAEAIDKITGEVYGSDAHTLAMQRWVPRGVVAAVVPWNFPTYAAILKIAPALAAGNCVVLKPSELSSRSALHIAELALQAGLPPGVLNVVPGLGETVGRALGLHRDVDMMTFTGSTAVGKRILQYAGQSNLKVVLAECGGKSPHIVFGDGVDLDSVADVVSRMLLTNQGQICSAGSRLLVQRSAEPALLERIVARFGAIVMGDALDPATTFGPLASAQQHRRVLKYVEAAQAEGAQLVVGGRKALPKSGGYFTEPTVFRNVSPRAQIAQEEVFGPVLSIIPFDSEAEAIRIANGTMYGLMSYVWTADLSTGMRIAKRMRSSVRINAVAPRGEGVGYAASHEPAGESGIGTEGGLAGMRSYLRRQGIWVNHA